jgi:hypothetical protein
VTRPESPRRRIRSVGWLANAMALFGLAALPAAGEPAACRRVPLDPGPRWSSWAAWSPDGGELAIVDVRGARLLRYSSAGVYLGAVTRPGRGELEFDHPTQLAGTSDGFRLENPPGRTLWLDRNYRSVRSIDFLTAKGSPRITDKVVPYGLASAVVVADELIGYATLHVNGRPWLGFVRVSMKPVEVVELIEEIPHGSPEDRVVLWTGAEDVSRVADATYALRYGEPTAILQLTPVKRRLRTFPADFTALPVLPPEVGGPSAGPIISRVLERSTVATNLQGHGSFLYLLTRRPAAQGTLWQLWQIDPRRDVLVRALTLPTAASDIFLAPGPKSWALVEKGPVTRPGEREIRNMLLLPAEWIEDPSSKVLSDGRPVGCR